MILALFVDGLGLGGGDPRRNPLAGGRYPALNRLLREAMPLYACLDVPGLPQSSTGQVSLFSGRNAAEVAGGHRPGFPGPRLRRLLAADTFYHRVRAGGGKAVFLNAFGRQYLRRMATGTAPVSASTLAAVAAGLPLADQSSLRRGHAVYHDLTGDRLRAQGEDVPLMSPEQSACIARDVASRHDLTLFEYFLTDLAGHRCEPAFTDVALGRLERFVAHLMAGWSDLNGSADAVGRDAGEAGQGPTAGPCYDRLVLFSDHGNVEDQMTHSHTGNPVPLAVWPTVDEATYAIIARCRSITDVAGALVALSGRGGSRHGRQEPQDARV